MLLHIVNKSPFDTNAIDSCLKNAADGSAILLIEDGIYAAINNSKVSDKVKSAMSNLTVYALEPDIKARGMQDKIMEGIKMVDYNGFVDLTVEHGAVQSWL